MDKNIINKMQQKLFITYIVNWVQICMLRDRLNKTATQNLKKGTLVNKKILKMDKRINEYISTNEKIEALMHKPYAIPA